MIYQPPDFAHVNYVQQHHQGGAMTSGSPGEYLRAAALGGMPIKGVEVGSTYYPFRSTQREMIGPTFYSVEGLDTVVVGEGETLEAAKESFERQLHMLFQTIAGKQDF